MSPPKFKKYCVVPKCKNSTFNAPEKLFFLVPFDSRIRKKWIKVMRRADAFGDKSPVYCCEDHFDIENDMENYVKYKLVGGQLKLRKGAVPHKFECQKEIHNKPERSAVHKRNLIRHLEKVFNTEDIPRTEPRTSFSLEKVFIVSQNEEDLISSENNDQHLVIAKNRKAVPVRLKNVHNKATITEEIYFEKVKKTIVRRYSF